MAGVSRIESHAASATQHLAQIRSVQETQTDFLFAAQKKQANTNDGFQSLQHTLPIAPQNGKLYHHNSENLVATNAQNLITYPEAEEMMLIEEQSASPLQVLPTPRTTATYQSLAVNAHFRYNGSCETSCHCKCHVEQRVASPLSLVSLLGQLFIGYKALPGIHTRCTDPPCQKDRNPTFNISYFFPRWWMRDRMMMLRAKYQTWQGPEIALAFPRIVPRWSPVFIYSSAGGSVEPLIDLFSRGLASPKDLRVEQDGSSLITPLENAIVNRTWPVVQFLVRHGPGLDIGNERDMEVFTLAWRYVLSKAVPIQTARWLAELFPYPGNDLFGFSSLHEAVLDLGITTVEQEIFRLSTSTATINDRDNLDGSTALLWAAARGDIAVTNLLLRHGADPNIPNQYGSSPLLPAINLGKSKCVPLLLQNGADPHTRDRDGYNAFHKLAFCVPCPLFSETAEALNTYKVNINSQNNSGSSVIGASIAAKNCECLAWLLKHDADYHIYNRGTILHYLGWHGTLEMVKIMREAKLMGIDIHDLEPDESCTALMMMHHPARKVKATQELVEEFALLLNEIEQRTSKESSRQLSFEKVYELDSGEESEDEVFHDSLGDVELLE